jgi:WD40 repeat protein
MLTYAGHVVWVWCNCHSSDPQVCKELNCVGKDILSLLASSSGAFVFCGSIAGFVVVDAKSGENMTVGHVDEGITDVVEVKRERGQGMHRGGDRGAVPADASSEIWCIHGNSKLACWDAATFSSGQCKHVGVGRVSGLVALPNGQVWSGSSDGRISVWNAKNKRVIRALGMRHTSAYVSKRQHTSAYVSILVCGMSRTSASSSREDSV